MESTVKAFLPATLEAIERNQKQVRERNDLRSLQPRTDLEIASDVKMRMESSQKRGESLAQRDFKAEQVALLGSQRAKDEFKNLWEAGASDREQRMEALDAKQEKLYQNMIKKKP